MDDNFLNNKNLNLFTDNNDKPNEIINNNFDENILLLKLVNLDSNIFKRKTKCKSIHYYESLIKLIKIKIFFLKC